MSDIRAAADTAKAFADQHAQELAAEIVEWQDTAVLRDGKLRELARLCGFAGNDALIVANHIATLAALEVAARKRPEAEVAEIMETRFNPIVRALVNAACRQEREPSVDNQNAYWVARDALDDELECLVRGERS